ncbi:MAG: hypothetical protein WCA57_09735 [Ilumatobacteraceae bacterium]|jgi:hypothetical protein
MWGIERFVGPLCAAALIAAGGCGGDGGSSSTDSNVATTVPDTVVAEEDGATTETAQGVMTIEALCDPLDDVVNDWIVGDIERLHMDMFASEDPASLTCEWQGEPDHREVRVTYHASPAVWDATVVSGGDPLDAVDADSSFDGEILSVHADNGWTIDVIAFEGDPPGYVDAPDLVTPIANAALAAAS